MSRKTKQAVGILLDVLVAACTVLCLVLLYRHVGASVQRRVMTVLLCLPLLGLLCYEVFCRIRRGPAHKNRDPHISTLVLLGEDDRPIRIWDLTGKVGVLIGKSSDEFQVDIDLAGTDYETFLDPEHAVLNYIDAGWLLQDTSSRNGVSVLRKGEELKIGHNSPLKLEPGDTIVLAKYTRIAVN